MVFAQVTIAARDNERLVVRAAVGERERMMDGKLPRSAAARTAPPRRPNGARADRRPPAFVRSPMVKPTHAVASQIADRTMPPRFARNFDAAPTARTAELSTSIRPCDRARSIAGLPLPSRRSVLSLMALDSERFARSASVFVKIAD